MCSTENSTCTTDHGAFCGSWSRCFVLRAVHVPTYYLVCRVLLHIGIFYPTDYIIYILFYFFYFRQCTRKATPRLHRPPAAGSASLQQPCVPSYLHFCVLPITHSLNCEGLCFALLALRGGGHLANKARGCPVLVLSSLLLEFIFIYFILFYSIFILYSILLYFLPRVFTCESD